MTRSCEATGKNIAEATRNALRELGIARDEADITVVARGRRGFLGLFQGAPAKVRVSHRVSVREDAERLVSDMLRLMRFSSQLHITEEKNTLVIDIETAGSDGLLIGKAGHTLSAVEYLTNRMLQKESKKGVKVVLDVSGYKRRREDFLTAKALSLAKQVKTAKKQVTMEPLDAADRRVVHAVLKADPSIETTSIGQGRVKSIVVAPVTGTPKDGKPTRGPRSSRGSRGGRGSRGSRAARAKKK
jgi:spoIIIJ-associated protein